MPFNTTVTPSTQQQYNLGPRQVSPSGYNPSLPTGGASTATSTAQAQADQYLDIYRQDIERTNSELLASQQAALKVPGQVYDRFQNDPTRQAAIEATYDQLNDPGLSREVINQMKSELFRSNSTAALGRARQQTSRQAQYGQSGARTGSLRSLSNAQSALANSIGANRIDIEAAQQERQGEQFAISSLNQLSGQANQMNQFVGSSLQNQYNQWQPQVADLAPWMQQLGAALGQQAGTSGGYGGGFGGGGQGGLPGGRHISSSNPVVSRYAQQSSNPSNPIQPVAAAPQPQPAQQQQPQYGGAPLVNQPGYTGYQPPLYGPGF